MKTVGKGNFLALLLGAGFLFAISLLVIGNYKYRLAAVHADSGAIFYSYLYAHASEFRGDVFGYTGVHWLWGTICFWFPTLASRYFGLDPRIPDYIFYLLQVFLIGLSIFILTWQVSRSWLTAFASMALALVVQPWAWNLAAYGVTIEIPFYTTLAEALATLAGAAFLARRWNIAWLLALATATVHPVIACYLLVMLCAWILLNRAQLREWLLPSTLVKIALLLALCGAPFLVGQGITEPLMTPQEHWVSVSKLMHGIPWGNTSTFRSLAIRLLGFLLILLCCWRPFLKLTLDQRNFLLAVAAGTLVLAGIHLTGIFLKLPNVTLIMGLRAFSNFVLFFWPFAFTILFSRNFLERFPLNFTLLTLALVWYPVGGGIPVFNLALFVLALVWPDNFLSQRRPIYIVILAALPLALISLGYSPWIFPRASTDVGVGYYLAALLVSIVLADLFTLKRVGKPLRVVITAGLLLLALARAEEIGDQTHNPDLIGLYNAEIWARDHTPPGTMFMTTTSWRTVSQRPAAELEPNLTMEIYTPFQSLRARNEILLRRYGIGDTWRGMSTQNINIACAEGYRSLKEADFVWFSKAFGAPYLVRSTQDGALDFPVVYQNAGYRIYQVREP